MTGKIDPHNDIEFQILAKGEKDLAYFEADALPDNIEQSIKIQRLEVLRFHRLALDKSVMPDGVIVYRSGKSAQAKRLASLTNQIKHLCTPDHDRESIEREIGKLLGYSREDIEVWVSRLKSVSSNQFPEPV